MPSYAQSMESAAFIGRIGSEGTADGQLKGPVAVRIIGNQIYVSDTQNEKISVYDMNGQFQYAINNTIGGSVDQLKGGYKVASNGTNLFIPDYFHNRVTVHSMNGDYITEFGSSGTADEQTSGPIAISFVDNRIVVSCFGSSEIKIYNQSTLAYIKTIGQDELASSYASLTRQWGITTYGGVIYTADYFNFTLKAYDIFGYFLNYVKVAQHPVDLEYRNGFLAVLGAFNTLYVYDTNFHLLETTSLGPSTTLGVQMFDMTDTTFYVANLNEHNVRTYRLVASPEDITAVKGDTAVSLSWKIHKEKGLTVPIEYEIYRTTAGESVFLGSTADLHFTDSAIVAGNDYTYSIRAVSRIGISDTISSGVVSIAGTDNSQTTVTVTTTEITSTGSSNPVPFNIYSGIAAMIMIPVVLRKKKN